MKLTKKQIKKYLEFLVNNKHYMGLTDFDIELKNNARNLGGDLAEVKPDDLEKKLLIELSNDFLKAKPKEQANILFHELIHARVAIMNERQAKGDTAYFEECFVNDLVRGFERGGIIKWN